ncbi:MAG: gliding motility protein GldN [Bacteroidales bacterium]|jgi:gliding motility associated protien GldN|nr:gliding motility protein GldN [Bacteroidales bacterium]
MKHKIVYFGLGALILCGTLRAQNAAIDSSNTVLEYKKEVYTKENIPGKKPIPLAYVREADVIFDKTVWRMIDLREKRNLALYYPTANIGSRVNLVNLLLKGVDSGEINAYDPNDFNNEFSRVIGKTELDQNFGAKHDTIQVTDADGNMIAQERKLGRQTDQVTMLLVKEHVYFDKKHSVLNRELIAVCPIRVFTRDDGVSDSDSEAELQRVRTMWIYIPEARSILARHPVFNRFNDAMSISFDDFLMNHHYEGSIYQISNVYNNRSIEEYASGIDALYEAQRIEDEIFNWEQALWEY